ncbi:MAG: hypothetical protein NTX72_02435 [Candidatus Uhrbacteria bacterium]|nr:hypothetical protein [Candidatus Uhrbacteria bacterium]
MKFLARLIQVMLILTPICILGWLGVENFVPSGTFSIQHSVHDASSFIDALAPHERVSDPKKDAEGNWIQTIVADPVFFFVHPHRSFDTVDATVTFKNTNTPLVEFGALASTNPERYILEPLQNLLIDQSTWSRTVDGEMILLQRKSTYKTIADFLAHPPSREEVATYHTDLSVPFRLANYSASNVVQTIPVSLRGAEVMKTYLKNEPIHFVFSYMDMNRDNGSDPITISVTDETGRPIISMGAEDDGNISSNAHASIVKTLALDTSSLPEGVYKIELQADRDIFVRSIQTTQQKIVFLNGVYLGDEDGYHQTFAPVTFWTEAKRLSMQTRHAASVQTVMIGSKPFSITTPYQLTTTLVTEPGLIPVHVAKGDVEVLADAPVAFSPAQYFRPDTVRLLPHTDLDQLHVNYVLAKYTPPIIRDGWTIATVHLDAQKLLLDQGSWKFTFSTPEIAEMKSSIDVKAIDLVMKRPAMLWYEKFLASIK